MFARPILDPAAAAAAEAAKRPPWLTRKAAERHWRVQFPGASRVSAVLLDGPSAKHRRGLWKQPN